MDKNYSEILNTLSESERKLFPYLKKTLDLNKLIELSHMERVEVMRALMWLSNKKIIETKVSSFNAVVLDTFGEQYKKEGFPEKKILQYLSKSKKSDTKELAEKLKLSEGEISSTIGILKRNRAIDIEKKDSKLYLIITDEGGKIAEKKTCEEKFLEKKFPLKTESLSEKGKKTLNELKLRKNFIKVQIIKHIDIKLTEIGKKVIKVDYDFGNTVDTLSSSMLKDGSWKNKKFREYDISSPVPKIQRGRRHPVKEACNLIRDVFLEMGFQEMSGPWVETAFWCMDSMWIPQDHPARDVQDTFFIGKKGDLPKKELVNKVKQAHENGGDTGSTGYMQEWDEEKSKELLLRTHSTATTFRRFGLEKVNCDCKYFYIANTFRNEAVDATHLPEFLQAEGFIMADDLTLSDLMGFIKEFYAKIGITKIRFKPTYNPYTEPSMEAHYYDEKKKKWYALINSGIFRPEALYPYGIKKTVIAWGMGVNRIASLLNNKNNLRELVGATCDIEWIQNHRALKREL